jgi:hypothetical protein
MNMTLEQFDAMEEDALDIVDVLEDIILSSGNKYASISHWREKSQMPMDRWRAAARYLADEGLIHRQGGLVGFGPGPATPELEASK